MHRVIGLTLTLVRLSHNGILPSGKVSGVITIGGVVLLRFVAVYFRVSYYFLLLPCSS